MLEAEHGQMGSTPVDDIDLSGLDEMFAGAEIPEGFERVPDKDYEVRVDRVEIVKAKTTGNPSLKWTLEVLGPDCRGRKLWRYNVLNSQKNAGWLKKDLKACGITVEKASELPGILPQLLDLRILVRVKTKGESQNIYFVKLLEGAGTTSESGGSGSVRL